MKEYILAKGHAIMANDQANMLSALWPQPSFKSLKLVASLQIRFVVFLHNRYNHACVQKLHALLSWRDTQSNACWHYLHAAHMRTPTQRETLLGKFVETSPLWPYLLVPKIVYELALTAMLPCVFVFDL